MVPLVSEDINIVMGVPCHFPVLLVLLPQMEKKRSETSLKLSNTEGERVFGCHDKASKLYVKILIE